MPDEQTPQTPVRRLLSQYAGLARDTREKGSLFERLVRAFLVTDSFYSGRFDEVWLWQEWPGREGKVDTGIDLVARERYSGKLTAIQCKFYGPTHVVQKSDIDSFFTASGKEGFDARIIVTTTDKWSKHALDALVDQQIPTVKVGIDALEASEIDWSEYSLTRPDEMERVPRKSPRPYQQEAIADVIAGFETSDRGKLIMACGTGKTFTSLRLAEAIVPPGGSVLFLVPSIALLGQTLREWSAQREVPQRAFAICSDVKVGKVEEDYSVSDLSFPATTNTSRLLKAVDESAAPADGITVYFSTYQSIEVVARAQEAGVPEFDLVVCDEAHRTTGVTAAGGKGESSFVRVHDESFIKAKKRLYMTATPKIYGEAVKSKAKEAAAALISMDDESLYGPVFHRLGFGSAVERGLLTDYRVLILAVDEGTVNETFQQAFAAQGELNIPDAARIVGIYNGLAKRGIAGLGDATSDLRPMHRAVAFSRSIKDSKHVTALLDGFTGESVEALTHTAPTFSTASQDEAAASLRATDDLTLHSRHVDGTMNAMERTALLDWLKSTDAGEEECRILTNARCLSEGVDVPALDAVIFLNSRDSQIDVVQSVGRVMRRSAEKDYGYIILPIAVPAGVEPEKALNDNAKYKVVWDVLRALRSHDERFEAKIEQLDLNRTRDPQIQVIGFGDFAGRKTEGSIESVDSPLDFSVLGTEWRDAIYAKIVDKVGERDYWDNWAANVADIAARQEARIRTLVVGADARLSEDFGVFVKALQDNLNPAVNTDQAIEMLAQHLITGPIFDALFEDHAFSASNPVSETMQLMVELLQGENLETETAELSSFYDNVKRSVRGITDSSGRQTTIKRLYEKFFGVAFKKTSERLGIVYTPNEIVDFILHSTDAVLREEFGTSLSDEGVHILDPFTGTGTFIVNLLQSGLIRPEDLLRKFRYELHANEVVLLAYYVAAVNIEATFADLHGSYEPFPGIVLTDTFQTTEEDDQLDGSGVFEDNNKRVVEQNQAPISVIVGNPPYSVGQTSGNDNNQNLKYKTLDARIAATYAARSTATNKNSLYDSYIRAIRWASDRIGDRGVVAFVSNGGFVEGNTADGIRKSMQDEFDTIYLLNLRGNQRTSGIQSQKEGGKVFGSGSRATIVVYLLVKNPDATEKHIWYHDIGDSLTREEKLTRLSTAQDISAMGWTSIPAGHEGDWMLGRDLRFARFRPVASSVPGESMLDDYVRGLETGRDAWNYSSSQTDLSASTRLLVETFNSLVSGDQDESLDHPTRISWTSTLRTRLERRMAIDSSDSDPTDSSYRPFTRQHTSRLRPLIHRPGVLRLFPPGSSQWGITMTSPSTHFPAFAALATDLVPDLHLLDTGQFFPRYTVTTKSPDQIDVYDVTEDRRRDNVTDESLDLYRALYDQSVTKDEIFYFIYGILHSPDYRERYAADLKKMLPRIPNLANAADFHAFAKAGQELADIHLDYEQVAAYEGLELVWADSASASHPAALRVEKKMRYGGKPGAWDKSVLHYNEHLTIRGIPLEAQEYLLGSRSALDWIIDRYYVRTDKASGIVNDANKWGDEHGNPAYILDLIRSIVSVSVETVRIVKSLPPLRISPEYEERIPSSPAP